MKTWTDIRKAVEKRHSGTVGVAACVVVGMWYLYAAGYTPEPPVLVMAAAAVAVSWALNHFVERDETDSK